MKSLKKIAYITIEWVDAYDLNKSINDIHHKMENGIESFMNIKEGPNEIALQYGMTQKFDLEPRRCFEKEIDGKIQLVVKSKI